MTSILCFRLFGPLAAWGTLGSGAAIRDTARHPSRGALIGMVAAALGIRREDEDALAALGASIVTAVASHGRRRVKADFRTVQTVESGKRSARFRSRADALANGLRVHTTTTQRFHVEDGLWRAFVTEREPGAGAWNVQAIADAFTRPAFELYLGRREFPLALPPGPMLHGPDLAHALEAYPAVPHASTGRDYRELPIVMNEINRQIIGNGEFDLAWEVSFPGPPTQGRSRRVIDDPASRIAWRFAEREERYATGLKPTKASEKPGWSLGDEFFPRPE